MTVGVSFLTALMLFAEPIDDAHAITGLPLCAGATTLCVGLFRHAGGPRMMAIGGPKAKYFRKYELCVRAPNGTRECDVFRIPPPQYGHFFAAIVWRRHFTKRGPGRYVAGWRRLPSKRLVGRRSFNVG